MSGFLSLDLNLRTTPLDGCDAGHRKACKRRAIADAYSDAAIGIGGMSGSRTRISRLQGGGSAQLSYHPIRNGAWSWFRANLSAASTRRCHQISFPGLSSRIGADEENRTPFAGVAPQH
jgi:hypothetical protein